MTQIGSDVTWTSEDTATKPLENRHNCLMVGTSIQHAVNIKSVQVFSKYPLMMGCP